MEITKSKQQQLVAYLSELIGEEATNGELSPNLSVFNYMRNGNPKSFYLDWRTHSQMQKKVFSYSNDFIVFAKVSYEMVVILNADNISDTLLWNPKQVDYNHNVIMSYLEFDNEPIYTFNYNTPNRCSHEAKTN